MVQGMPGVQSTRDIVHCEHIKSQKYSLLWWEECPECKGGAYIAHRCMECGEEYTQEEGAHAHWKEKDPDLAEFAAVAKNLHDIKGPEAWQTIKGSALYKRVASVYEKTDLFKLFMKARETR